MASSAISAHGEGKMKLFLPLTDINLRRRLMLMLSSFAFVTVLMIWFDDNYMFVITEGASMYKTLGTFSVALVKRTWTWHDFDSLKEGDLVVFERYKAATLECKRVKWRVGEAFWVDGETKFSFDSDHYGPISGFQIRGKIVWYRVLRRDYDEAQKLDRAQPSKHQEENP